MRIETFFDAIRPIFGGSLSQSQVDGINIILEAWTKYGDGDNSHLAYVLATAKHESASTMQPVRETLAKTDAKAKEILTKAFNAGRLPWVKRDYWSGGFFGRGLVQLTHAANYRSAGKKLGIDLVSDPSKAMIPEISAAILVRGMVEGWFTGKAMKDFSDFETMRKVVNGTDRAKDIADVAHRFQQAIRIASIAIVAEAPEPVKKSPGFMSSLIDLLKKIGKYLPKRSA